MSISVLERSKAILLLVPKPSPVPTLEMLAVKVGSLVVSSVWMKWPVTILVLKGGK